MEELHRAIEENDDSLVRRLLDGDSIRFLHIDNDNGVSAYQLAYLKGNPSIITICREFAERYSISTTSKLISTIKEIS